MATSNQITSAQASPLAPLWKSENIKYVIVAMTTIVATISTVAWKVIEYLAKTNEEIKALQGQVESLTAEKQAAEVSVEEAQPTNGPETTALEKAQEELKSLRAQLLEATTQYENLSKKSDSSSAHLKENLQLREKDIRACPYFNLSQIKEHAR